MLLKVEEIFLEIKPLLPIPAKINFPLHFDTISIALINDLSKHLFSFFKAIISLVITSFAILLKFLPSRGG